MASKELIEKVARVICFETGKMGDPMPIEMQRVDRDWQEHTTAAKAAIFAVHAALQEPTEKMVNAVFDDGNGSIKDDWQTALNASPLAE